MNYLTLDEALAYGYKFFMVDERVYHLDPQELEEFKGENVELCEIETDYMQLSPEDIIEQATEDLHEDAKENVLQTDEYKKFEVACKELCEALKGETETHHPSGKYIKV